MTRRPEKAVLRIAVLIALMICGLAAVSFADTIKLKDGSIIKGTIVSFENGKFTVVVGEGERRRQLSFDAMEIESIQFDQVRPQNSVPPVVTGSKSVSPVRVIVSDNLPAETKAPTKAEPAPSKQASQAKVADETRQPVKPPDSGKSGSQAPAAKIEPITVRVNVLADNTYNGWTNSGWVVRKGQKIKVTGSGEIDLGGGRKCPPGGLADLEDPEKLLKSVPTGALIAVIGDDNNDFIYIGDEREFVAARDGALFLGVNEGKIEDNSGTFQAIIQIWPN